VIQQIASALKADLSAGCPAGRLYGESFGAALRFISNTSPTLKQNIQNSDGLPKHKPQQATDYIQAHLDQDIKLVGLANTVGISQYYFCRLFKQSMHDAASVCDSAASGARVAVVQATGFVDCRCGVPVWLCSPKSSEPSFQTFS